MSAQVRLNGESPHTQAGALRIFFSFFTAATSRLGPQGQDQKDLDGLLGIAVRMCLLGEERQGQSCRSSGHVGSAGVLGSSECPGEAVFCARCGSLARVFCSREGGSHPTCTGGPLDRTLLQNLSSAIIQDAHDQVGVPRPWRYISFFVRYDWRLTIFRPQRPLHLISLDSLNE